MGPRYFRPRDHAPRTPRPGQRLLPSKQLDEIVRSDRREARQDREQAAAAVAGGCEAVAAEGADPVSTGDGRVVAGQQVVLEGEVGRARVGKECRSRWSPY